MEGSSRSLVHRRLEAPAVGVIVAISTERDQIFVYIVTQQASQANVVDPTFVEPEITTRKIYNNCQLSQELSFVCASGISCVY